MVVVKMLYNIQNFGKMILMPNISGGILGYRNELKSEGRRFFFAGNACRSLPLSHQ